MSNEKTKTLKQKMEQLNELVNFFDNDDFDLETALVKYKEAEILSEDIRKNLEDLNNEIKVLKERFDTTA